MKTKHLGIMIGIPIVFFVLFFPIVYYPGPGAPSTETIDTQLFETRLLDWINTEREKQSCGINLDGVLDGIAAQQATIIANTDPKTIQEIDNQNYTQVVNSYGYECTKENGTIGKIDGIILRSVHSKFLNVESITDWHMTQLFEHDEARDMLLDPDLEKIGIGIAISDENIFALHHLC